jgi:16S rRNA (cytidine1402-2'-O)-methyltransferase
MTDSPILYLVPTPIDGFARDPKESMSAQAIAALERSKLFVVENQRSADKLLSRLLSQDAISRIRFVALNEHVEDRDIPAIADEVAAAGVSSLVSEAGMPCIADPGAKLVALAHHRGIRVAPMPGPSSIPMALAASGFDGQRFRFLGYLPPEASERSQTVARLSRETLSDGQTRIFIETPYRNAKLLDELIKTVPDGLALAVAFGIGTDGETIISKPIAEWRASPIAPPKVPAVFLLGTYGLRSGAIERGRISDQGPPRAPKRKQDGMERRANPRRGSGNGRGERR